MPSNWEFQTAIKASENTFKSTNNFRKKASILYTYLPTSFP